MKKSITFKNVLFTAIIISIFSTISFSAQSGYINYVTDSLEVPIRTGAGYQYKIKKMIRSGSKVTILEVNQKRWAKVTYQHKGQTLNGWMPIITLQNTPITKTLLKKQIQKTSSIEKQHNQLKVEMTTLDERYKETSEELKKIKTENFQLESDLDELKSISGKSIQINQQNEKNIIEIKKLTTENSTIKDRLSQANDVVQRQWFLTGGGVLLLGLLLGRFFRIPTKKTRWDTL